MGYDRINQVRDEFILLRSTVAAMALIDSEQLTQDDCESLKPGLIAELSLPTILSQLNEAHQGLLAALTDVSADHDAWLKKTKQAALLLARTAIAAGRKAERTASGTFVAKE